MIVDFPAVWATARVDTQMGDEQSIANTTTTSMRVNRCEYDMLLLKNREIEDEKICNLCTNCQMHNAMNSKFLLYCQFIIMR
jgi:hypothetical protein